MRKKIVAGNWKMNKNLQEGIELVKEINTMLEADKPACDVVVCTPFIHLHPSLLWSTPNWWVSVLRTVQTRSQAHLQARFQLQ